MTEPGVGANSIRIDQWLWHARIVKSRTLAQKLVASGKVRINREKTTSASHVVSIGDVLTISLERDVIIREILAIGQSRRPYEEAKLLYRDLTPARAPAQETENPMPAPSHRPGAQDRRALRRLSGKLF